MRTIFALTTGRSGTRFLSHLFRNNCQNIACRHEPYFDFGNPSMFGMPILWRHQGKIDSIRRQLQQKKKRIEKYKKPVYIETSHAFLKSWFDLALEYFPNSQFVHLSRNPMKTARSEANRETQVDKFRVPYRYCHSEKGTRFFRWALTGQEPIFGHFDQNSLSLFQWYLVQWIEIENRAMQFLEKNQLQDRCIHLHSTQDLNDPSKMQLLFDQLALETKTDEIVIAGKKNRTPGAKTVVSAKEEAEFQEVIAALPESYLEIFQRAPYSNYDWARQLGNRKRQSQKAA